MPESTLYRATDANIREVLREHGCAHIEKSVHYFIMYGSCTFFSFTHKKNIRIKRKMQTIRNGRRRVA